MCGILGEIALKGSLNSNLKKFKKALRLLSHRGPDDSNIYYNSQVTLGHTRLSIIDLNMQATQPMMSKCGNYVIVFNGEIYNFQEIKTRLHKKYHFKTNSDTEVLLYCYIEYGIKCLDMFNGMFSFAIYDNKQKITYIVRDRLGIKPLYYFQNEDALIFSSEVKSIFAYYDIEKKINLEAVYSYFSFRYPILNDTFFQNINVLAPAHFLKISQNKIEEIEYWNSSYSFKEQSTDLGEQYYISKIREILNSSVKYRMISDVPVGSFLSGGVDSSIIAAIMNDYSDCPVKTFTMGFDRDQYNEFNYAKMVADKFNMDYRELKVSSKDYFEVLNKLILYKDAPLSVPNEVPLYLMSKELKKDITVVLSGEAADELFGGYGRIFRSPYDLERLNNISDLNFTSVEKEKFKSNFVKKYGTEFFETDLDHFLSIYMYMSAHDKQNLLAKDKFPSEFEINIKNRIKQCFDELEEDCYTNKILYTFEKIHLTGLLQRVDTVTMAASVEARIPFADHRLVEFVHTIPLKYKLKWKNNSLDACVKTMMSDGISEVYDIPKYILKKAYEDKLPNEVLYRKKMGFPVPLKEWFAGDFYMYAKKLLLNPASKSKEFYNVKYIEKILNNKNQCIEPQMAMNIWMMINLELFMLNNFDN